MTIDPVIQQLVDAFHRSLEGITVAERKKSFHSYLHLLNTSTNGDSEKVAAVVDNIVPKNFWEDILKVDIILHFQLFAKSLEILKSDNRLFIAKLLKSAWFIRKLIDNFTPEQFVSELFSFTSVSTRVRIINKLIKCNKDEEFSKQLFTAYSDKYGLFAAKQLLPMCPIEVVEDIVFDKKIKLSTATVHKVIGKNVKLSKHFLKEYENKSNVKYIASTNLQLLYPILQDEDIEINTRFGKSITHRVVKKFKSYVTENLEKCLRILKQKRMYFDLKGEYEQLVYKLMTEKTIEHYTDFMESLSPLPKQKRLQLYLNGLKEVAKCTLEEQPEYINEAFLDLCENPNDRDKFAQLKYNTEKEVRWIKYMLIDHSIPLLKEKISLAPKPHNRQQMVEAMVETCRINNDTNALLDVLKYVVKRFRNDKENTRNHFCSSVLDNFKLHELTKEHWDCINELEKLFKVNSEYFFGQHTLMNEKMIYYLKNSQPIKNLLVEYRDSLYALNYTHRAEANVEKEFILQTVAFYNDESDEEEKLQAYVTRLLPSIQCYNSRHQDDRINATEVLPFKWIIPKLKESSKTEYIDLSPIAKYHIFEVVPPEDKDEVIDLLFEAGLHLDTELLLHFVKQEPFVLVKYLENFLKYDIILDIIRLPKALQYYKRLTNLNINDRTVYYYKQFLEGEVDASQKPRWTRDVTQLKSASLKVLSVCMNEQEYINLVKQYYPDEAHLNTESEESNELYQLRQSICQNLHNLNTSSLALNVLLPFCIGDYLKFSMKNLYHLCFHTQECKLPNVINELRAKAVSVRKHAVFLSLTALDRNYTLKFLTSYTEQEKNASIIAHVLLSISKYFTRNLDNDFFELFKYLLKKIDKNDENTFEVITRDCKLPDRFVAQYVEFVWNTLEEFGKNGCEFENKKFALLNHLNEHDYGLLDDKFLDRIVIENFLKVDKEQIAMKDFVLRYLFYCNSDEKRNHRLQLVFKVLREFKEMNANNTAKVYRFNANFVNTFSNFALKYKETTVYLVMQFKKNFSDFMDSFEYFDEYLQLDLLILHTQNIADNYLENFARRTAIFIESLEVKYGVGGVTYCRAQASSFIKKSIRSYDQSSFTDNLFQFLQDFYDSSSSVGVGVVSTALLENIGYDVHPETRVRHDALIEKLKTRVEPVIKLFLNSFLRSCC